MAFRPYMDVHVPSAVTEGLRRCQVDVMTAQEDGTREADDESLLHRASELDRLLFTQDEDFLRITSAWQSDGRDFSAVIFCPQLDAGIGEIIDDLELICVCARPDEV
jgi:hypothetical protein